MRIDSSRARRRAIVLNAMLSCSLMASALPAWAGVAGEQARALARTGFEEQAKKHYQAAMNAFYAALQAGGLDAREERNVRLAWADSALASAQPNVVKDALAPYAGQHDNEADTRLSAALEALRYARLDEAYAHLRTGDDAAALNAFRRGFAEAPGSAGQYADAAYAARRTGDNEQAARWFEAALDAHDNRTLNATTVFGYQREVEQLKRHWGTVISLDYQGTGLSPTATRDVGQMGAEVYLQPAGVGYRDGKVLQVFARAYQTVYDGTGQQTGSDTAQAALGARYKPFSAYSVVFSAERLLAAGDLARTDWLLRAAGSLGEGGDWHPASADWTTWSAYVEAARYLDAGQSVQTAEARYGHSWALTGGAWAVTPHLVISGDHDSLESDPTSAGIGPGISLRGWFGGDRHMAPPSWFDLTLQYRKALTDAERGHGVSAHATLWW